MGEPSLQAMASRADACWCSLTRANAPVLVVLAKHFGYQGESREKQDVAEFIESDVKHWAILC